MRGCSTISGSAPRTSPSAPLDLDRSAGATDCHVGRASGYQQLLRRSRTGVRDNAAERSPHLRRQVREYLPLGRRGPAPTCIAVIRRLLSPKLASAPPFFRPLKRRLVECWRTKQPFHLADMAASGSFYRPGSDRGLRCLLSNLAVCGRFWLSPDTKENELIGFVLRLPSRSSSLYRQADRFGPRASPLKPSSPSKTRDCSAS